MYIWENAQGTYGPPYLVFQGETDMCIPECLKEADEDVVWCGWSPSGMMDPRNYELCRCKMINWVHSHFGTEAHLEIIDNHYSHLTIDQLFTAACHNIHVVGGPSGLTSSWQVNDWRVNKAVHESLTQKLERLIELKCTPLCSSSYSLSPQNREAPSFASMGIILRDFIISELRPGVTTGPSRFRKAAVDSAKHRGIWPLDRSVVLKAVAEENPMQWVQEDKLIQKAVNLVKQHLDSLDHLKAEIDAETQKRKKSKIIGLDTSHAQELTAPGQLARNKLRQDFLLLKGLSAHGLHQNIIENNSTWGFTDEELYKPNGDWKPKTELISLIQKHFERQLEGLSTVYRNQIELLRSPDFIYKRNGHVELRVDEVPAQPPPQKRARASDEGTQAAPSTPISPSEPQPFSSNQSVQQPHSMIDCSAFVRSMMLLRSQHHSDCSTPL